MAKRFFMKLYVALVVIFLYAPIAVLIVLSFNASLASLNFFCLLCNSLFIDTKVLFISEVSKLVITPAR